MQKVETTLGANTLSIESGKVAKQANGSALVRFGDTVVLATACSTEPREGIDFFPLTVDYREYNYAAGKIPGGFFKREGRPTEKEILTSRLIDRPVRPLFPEGFNDETQVIAMVLSADSDNNPDVIGMVAGTAALYLSDIPFYTPVGAVRVSLVEGKLVTNPTYAETKASLLNLIVAGTEDAIVMVEAGAKEVSEESILEALQYGHAEIRKIVALQKELFEKLGIKKREFVASRVSSTTPWTPQNTPSRKASVALWKSVRNCSKPTRRMTKTSAGWPNSTSDAWKNTSFATTWWRSASGLTTALSTRCVRSAAKSAFCRALMVPPCLLEVRRRRW
jgi:polyribonucleotide nucleotidyltransferase